MGASVRLAASALLVTVRYHESCDEHDSDPSGHGQDRLYPRAVLTSPDLDLLISDTEAEILRVIDQAEDERTLALYEMARYHLGLDRDGPRGKRLRPLLG